ncbi:hypothetical protein [Bifidobacterium simiiventris]|uniref:hypothetical protein n=1 Tax=Bifidobacterium simiiventris TaxID=2834434 RepID=UPI001C58B447|nr:hypothetical protein [Bifidobacterium simiiventris]MBW3078230.1 hypothetical protein [Bifidobacterium simiiventris]
MLHEIRILVSLLLSFTAALLVQLEEYRIILALLLLALLIMPPDTRKPRAERIRKRGANLQGEKKGCSDYDEPERFQYPSFPPQLPTRSRISSQRRRLQTIPEPTALLPTTRIPVRHMAPRQSSDHQQPIHRPLQQGTGSGTRRPKEVDA